MFNLFGSPPSYHGSALERLVDANIALTVEFNKESVDQFAAALVKEYPRPFDLFLQKTGKSPPDEKLLESLNAAFPSGVAVQAILLIKSATGMAQYYGREIDQLKMTNVSAAFALGCTLAEYLSASSVSAADCDAGYRRHLSAYLALRHSMEVFGVLGPWEQRIAAVEADAKNSNPGFSVPKADAETADLLRTFVPKSEQPILDQVFQRPHAIKSTVALLNMMPGVLDTMYLGMVLSMPQLFMTAQWSGHPPALYQHGKCTFCGATAPCQPCESRLAQFAMMSQTGGLGASQSGPASTAAAQMLINAGINPYR